MTNISCILIVDDDDTSNFIAQRQLVRYNIGAEIIVRSNGQEAMDYIMNAPELPDLVLLDINMPIMTGFEFLEWFSGSAYKGKTKFIMYSTSVRQEDKEEAGRYDDVIVYLEKPLTGDKIVTLIEAYGAR
jgi:CheY-like chemotaxis protein